MSDPKLKTRNVSIEYCDGDVEHFIKSLEAQIQHLRGAKGAVGTIKIEIEDVWDFGRERDVCKLNLTYKSMETQSERRSRISREEKANKRIEEEELREYKRLKEKYGEFTEFRR